MVRVRSGVEAGVEGDAGATHARLGGHNHAISGQVQAPPQVEAITEGAERGIESADCLVGLGTDEQTGGADAEDVARAIVLALVDIVVTNTLESAGAGRSKDSEFKETAAVPAHLLDADSSDGLTDGGGLDELVKTLGFGGAVLVQDPPPLLRRKAGTLRVGATNRVAEVAGAADAHELGTVGNSISGERCDVAPCDVMMVNECGATDCFSMARKTDWVSGASPLVTRIAPTERCVGLNRPYGASAASRARTCRPRYQSARR